MGAVSYEDVEPGKCEVVYYAYGMRIAWGRYGRIRRTSGG